MSYSLFERILATHPLQYGFRVGSKEPIFDPGSDSTVGERYNRCPVCEQWSPCDVRELLSLNEKLWDEIELLQSELELLREAAVSAEEEEL